jgi:hypothetical protein
MSPLSAATRERLAQLFDPADRQSASDMLATLGRERSGDPREPDAGFERICFAALRLSGGTLPGLHAALELARQDWRDLLMAAGFGSDVTAHLRWQPQRFTAQTAAQWRAGVVVPTVAYGPGASVEIGAGRHKQQRGTVLGLLALEPEPRYRVRTARGKDTDVAQSALRAAS